jgi:hypothetical protein
VKKEKFIKQRNAGIGIAMMGSGMAFILLGGMSMNTVLEGSLSFLTKNWGVFAGWFSRNPDLTMTVLFTLEIFGLFILVIALHEASHYFAYLLSGVPRKNVHYELRGINPCICADIPVEWKKMLFAAAAPFFTILVPAVILGMLVQSPVWKELAVFAGVADWVGSSSDVYLIVQYLGVPRTSKIREAKEGEIAEWEE